MPSHHFDGRSQDFRTSLHLIANMCTADLEHAHGYFSYRSASDSLEQQQQRWITPMRRTESSGHTATFSSTRSRPYGTGFQLTRTGHPEPYLEPGRSAGLPNRWRFLNSKFVKCHRGSLPQSTSTRRCKIVSELRRMGSQ